MATRNLKPRPKATIAPLVTSTRALAEQTGIPEKKIRAALARFPEIPRSPLGRDILLSPAAVGAFLEALRGDAAPEATRRAVAEDDEPQTVDDVLASVGMKRAS